MRIVVNKKVGTGLKKDSDSGCDRQVSVDDTLPRKLFELCPKKDDVNILNLKDLSKEMGIGSLFAIDESNRLGLGSFKALGAVYSIAKIAMGERFHEGMSNLQENANTRLNGVTFATASAGNHGLSVAAGASLFGAESRIYVSRNVPEEFRERLKALGAKVTIHGENYEESQALAVKESNLNGWTLISDSTWEGYDFGLDIMEGYLISISQALEEIPVELTHVFLQAGVGGLAAAFAAFIREKLGYGVKIIIVEPSMANCLQASIENGQPTQIKGPVSQMGRLDCKYPSVQAFYSLSKTANAFVTISEREAEVGSKVLSDSGLSVSRSSSAGYVALRLLAKRVEFSLDKKSNVLCVFSEGLIQ